ncbi:hypothetical protein B0G76_3809 [Paraburkholderia sp. BL23I1N1]|uniref:hypothetical protein n=1 Tax=Paraburkholderia sp. BL23I1N1 TaxID=1938802 RepID=UPI000E76E186|nr:hypothetical protein [Paraburkholderia sp. BL23I1N1]RKE37550.1 hypothetical protein B0G76_3809 [Paraburkholderia sp. BL23I1N1]
MIDDQVNAEELAESRRQREAAANATDDGMPVAPENEKRVAEGIQYRAPKQWARHARKWLAAGGSFMRP